MFYISFTLRRLIIDSCLPTCKIEQKNYTNIIWQYVILKLKLGHPFAVKKIKNTAIVSRSMECGRHWGWCWRGRKLALVINDFIKRKMKGHNRLIDKGRWVVQYIARYKPQRSRNHENQAVEHNARESEEKWSVYIWKAQGMIMRE